MHMYIVHRSCICIYIYIYMYNVYVYIYIYICMYIYTVYMYVYIYICMYIYIYTYTYSIHIHIYINIYIYITLLHLCVEHSVKLVWVSFSNNATPTTLVGSLSTLAPYRFTLSGCAHDSYCPTSGCH